MKNLYLASLILLCFAACSQEAQPYTEVNESMPSSTEEQGYIETH